MNEELQQQIDILRKEFEELKITSKMPDHSHTGYDVSRIQWINIAQKKFYIYHTIFGVNAALTDSYGTFFIAPFDCVVTAFSEIHQVAGTDGGSVTLNLEKLTSGIAPDSGNQMLSPALSLKSTINVVQSGVLVTVDDPTKISYTSLVKDDRLCLKDSGNLTTVNTVSVLVELTML